MQPSLDLGARMLTALVLHAVVAIFSKWSDPLLKPFVDILEDPAALHVSCTNLQLLQQYVAD